jgi:tetratricopeptide (TPR) repeat protein
MAMRVLGIGPPGTLIASGRLNARERIVIADFQNQTRDSLLGPAVTQAFRVDFAQSTLVSPIEVETVRRALARMRRPDSVTLTRDLAREVAQRQGLKAVIAGELQQIGSGIQVSAHVISADSGVELATARAIARDSSQLIDAVDKVSKQLRERIGESLRSLRANAPLADVTTESLEALRKYSLALALDNRGDRVRAAAVLEEAVAADSNFAMGWRKLGTILNNDFADPPRARHALTRAYQLRDRATFRERRLTEASYYVDVRGDIDSATAALESLLAEYPDDQWALVNMGVFQEWLGNRREGRELYVRAVALDPESWVSLSNLYNAYIAAHRLDSAAALLDTIHQRVPAGPAVDELPMFAALFWRDFPTAERLIRAHMQKYPTDRAVQLQTRRLLAGVLAVQGKLKEADIAITASAETRRVRGGAAAALPELVRRIGPTSIYRGDTAGARRQLDQILKENPVESIPPGARPLYPLIQASYLARDQSRLAALLTDLERGNGSTPGRVRRFQVSLAHALPLSLRDATLPQAIAAFRSTHGPCEHCVAFGIAQAFDRARMPDSALIYYQQWADLPEMNWEPGGYNIWQPVGFYRLGELYEQKGDKIHAREFYGRFIDLWKDADPELQPRVAEARKRLRALGVDEPAGRELKRPR